MPSPKSGTAGSIVAPTDATPSSDADDADPGAVEAEKAFQRDAQTGKYGTVQVTPYKRPDQQADDAPPGQPDQPPVVKTSWIEIVLVDANDNPVAGENYQVTLPDNSVAEGSLDNNGFVRIDGIDPGSCQVTFPYLDGLSWDQQS